MIGNKRYLAFRTERLEKQNRWLTILVSAIIVVLVVAITAGPALVRALGEDAAPGNLDSSKQAGDLEN
ncbi:MAG: hypothetical protein ACR2Q3_10980 [Woeseiaceae bacterium]